MTSLMRRSGRKRRRVTLSQTSYSRILKQLFFISQLRRFTSISLKTLDLIDTLPIDLELVPSEGDLEPAT